MSFGGLIARAVLLKEQLKKKPCKRCGLLYDPKKEEKCPHCGDLDNKGLEILLNKKKKEFQGNKQLGLWFIFSAIVILFLLVFINFK